MSEQILACLECQAITDTQGPDGCCVTCLLHGHEVYLTPLVPASSLQALNRDRDHWFSTALDNKQKIEALKAENRDLRSVMDLNAAVILDTLGNHKIGQLCLDEAVSILSEVRSQLRAALAQGGE